MFTTLISATNLAGRDPHADWVIFDCRHDLAKPDSGRLAYQEGHIPGAHFAHTDLDLSGPKTGHNGRHPLPDPERLLRFLRAAGVNDQSQIVAYDASGGMYAARLWWLARWLGHERVAVLDGGLPAWLAAGLALTTVVPPAVLGNLGQRGGRAPSVDLQDVQANLESGARIVIDARAPERYRGDVEPMDPVAGHIPGAVNRFYQNNLQPDGRFKSAGMLREEFESVLKDLEPQGVIHQCGSGVTACHNLLAMEIAGLHGSALYPGSWSEWCSDPARPTARGGN